MVDLSYFHAHGYQFIKNVIDKKLIEEINRFLTQERDKTLNLIKQTIPFNTHDELIEKINALYEDEKAFEALDHNLKNMLCGHFSLECRLNPVLHLVPKSPVVQEIYRQIFPEQEPKMHLPPTARFILPRNRFAAVPPHQDVSYNKHVNDFFVLWIPFCAIDDKCGGVIVHEGTGHLPEQLTNMERKFWLKGIPDQGYAKIHRSMEMGDALLLNKWVIHESAGNTSDRVRLSSDFRFFHGHSDKHYLDMTTWKVVEPELAHR